MSLCVICLCVQHGIFYLGMEEKLLIRRFLITYFFSNVGASLRELKKLNEGAQTHSTGLKNQKLIFQFYLS